MLQDALDFAFLAAALYAWRAPVSTLVRVYLGIQVTAVLLYLWLKFFPATDQYTTAYAAVYWICVAAALLSMFSIIYMEGWCMIRGKVMRHLTAAWILLGMWYVGYFLNPRSEALDWCPDVILGTAFIFLGRRARVENRQRSSAPLPALSNTPSGE